MLQLKTKVIQAPTLYHIPASLGKNVEILFTADDEEAEIAILHFKSFFPSGWPEHVSVLADDKILHMYVDETGAIQHLMENARASLLYANATLRHNGRRPYSLEHVLSNNGGPLLYFQDALTMVERRLIIYGEALLWTGART